jgi:hypothetical protein
VQHPTKPLYSLLFCIVVGLKVTQAVTVAWLQPRQFDGRGSTAG